MGSHFLRQWLCSIISRRHRQCLRQVVRHLTHNCQSSARLSREQSLRCSRNPLMAGEYPADFLVLP